MSELDPDGVGAKVDTERQWLVSALRSIADRLDAMSAGDVIVPTTMSRSIYSLF